MRESPNADRQSVAETTAAAVQTAAIPSAAVIVDVTERSAGEVARLRQHAQGASI